jgi:hypothetical protein
MKRATVALTMATLAVSSVASAEEGWSSPHEVYLTSGLTFLSSDRRVMAGLGGGPGYRLNLSDRFSVYLEGRYLLYIGHDFVGAAGASYGFHFGNWEPAVGLQGAVLGGDRVAVLTSSHPTAPPAWAWAAQARLAPLRFRHAPFTVSALAVDVGFGDDGGARAFSMNVNVIEMGLRL